MSIPFELINKIIMMNRPVYHYLNELSCRLNLTLNTKIIKHIKSWRWKDYGPIRYYRIYNIYRYDDLLQYRDDELVEYGELSTLYE